MQVEKEKFRVEGVVAYVPSGVSKFLAIDVDQIKLTLPPAGTGVSGWLVRNHQKLHSCDRDTCHAKIGSQTQRLIPLV